MASVIWIGGYGGYSSFIGLVRAHHHCVGPLGGKPGRDWPPPEPTLAERLAAAAALHLAQEPPTKRVPLERLEQQIETADCFVVTHGDEIEPGGRLLRTLLSGVRSGKRLLVLSEEESLSPLLLEFDLAIRRQARVCRSPKYKPLPPLKTRDQQYAWDSPLLNGVEEIAVESASLTWYGDTAAPLLVCPSLAQFAGGDGDATPPGSRVAACAARWPQDRPMDPRVILIAADCLADSGVADPDCSIWLEGIDANRIFASNLIRWLVGGEGSSSPRTDPSHCVQGIETLLHDLVLAVLKREFGTDWWIKGVPKKIRKEAAALHEEEDDRAPKEVYLYLINLREIIESKWALFSELLESKEIRGKARALEWILKFNELRNRIAHPIKLRHHPLAPEDIAFLHERATFLRGVMERFGAAAGGFGLPRPEDP